MSTYTKFSRLSLATKIRLREKFTSEIFYQRKYPDHGINIIFIHSMIHAGIPTKQLTLMTFKCYYGYNLWDELLLVYASNSDKIHHYSKDTYSRTQKSRQENCGEQLY